MNIGFWNINRKTTLENVVLDLIAEKDLDILVLAEYLGDINSLCQILNNSYGKQYKPLLSYHGCDKIKGIINSGYAQQVYLEATRYTILMLRASCFQIVLAAIHAESKLHSNEADRAATYRQFISDVETVENETKCENTIMLGDFNSNPFDLNVINADTLHAIPYKEELKSSTRMVSGRRYNKFYNPMWKLLGKATAPYGTYYYNTSAITNYYWNIFDQFIIRPSLIPSFDENSLEILTNISDRNILTLANKPNSQEFSDHLPIYCELQEEKII